MGLRLKFNLVLSFVFVIGLWGAGYISQDLLNRNARDEVIRNASLIQETALAIRGYTVNQVRPNLEAHLEDVFLPQGIPAYAATETVNALRVKYPDYFYKEAALNPTNPRDRAADWEADLIQEFRNKPGTRELVGERDTPTGRSLFLARPIKILSQACLACHSTPAEAPPTVVKVYGESNGYGWKLGEIVGAQIVSVPMSVPARNVQDAFQTFMGSLVAIFLLAFILLNIMLSWVIIRPISKLSRIAEQVSTGSLNIPEFPAKGKDEVAVLGDSFNRMRRSLQKAMEMIER
jgi:protein-histidine pros-kinase